MLLVIGAEAAVQRTALLHRHLKMARQRARLVVLALAEIVRRIRREQGTHRAMLRAGLHQIDLVVLNNHLGLNDPQAPGAKAVSEIMVDVGAILALRERLLDGRGHVGDAQALLRFWRGCFAHTCSSLLFQKLQRMFRLTSQAIPPISGETSTAVKSP